MNWKCRLLGLVTLYNPDPEDAADNIRQYAGDLDELIIWDNSPLDANYHDRIMVLLSELGNKAIWHGTGENLCIAPAINYAWHYAQAHGHDMLLIMDQDSKWDNFAGFRHQAESYWNEGREWVFTPFFEGYKFSADESAVHQLRVFINSGTIIPTKILSAVGGADERLPLDAVDNDLSIRIQKHGYSVMCLTSYILRHKLGTPSYTSLFHLKTPNYSAQRTYSIARGHMINLRKHRDWLTTDEKRYALKVFYWRRIILILIHENDKWNRIKMLIKGTYDGLTLPLDK